LALTTTGRTLSQQDDPLRFALEPVETDQRRTGLFPLLMDIVAVTFAGALVRLGALLTAGFALHDGGMFVVMIRDIRAAGMALPSTTTYNGGGLPFDYPPLALWLAALVPADPLTVVRFAGPLAAVLTVPMVYLIALELLPGRPYAYVSALLYALIPRGWDWLVAGGSVTRSPGLLLAMVGVWMILRLHRTRQTRYVVGAAVFGGLASLTHPEASAFFLLAAGILALVRVRDRRMVVATIWIGVGFCLVVLPWLLILATQGHLLDLTQAGSQGVNPLGSIATMFMWQFTDEAFAPAILALGLIGALALAQKRSFFIVIWLLTEAGLALRGAPTYACIPLVLAASVGLYDSIGQGILRIPRPDVFRSNAVRGVLLLVLSWTVFNDVGLVYQQEPPFDSLSAKAVDTMSWLSANTPADARLAVVSGATWPNDVYGEWLPALSDRVSVATVHGREWLNRDEWGRSLETYDELQACVHVDAACLIAWTKDHPEKKTGYVFVVENLNAHALLLDVAASPSFEVIHRGDDGVVAKILASP
jgi:hypothetical protein